MDVAPELSSTLWKEQQYDVPPSYKAEALRVCDWLAGWLASWLAAWVCGWLLIGWLNGTLGCGGMGRGRAGPGLLAKRVACAACLLACSAARV